MASLNDIANKTANLEKQKANNSHPYFTGQVTINQDNDSIVLNGNKEYKGCIGIINSGNTIGLWNHIAGHSLGIKNDGAAFTSTTFTASKIYNAVWNDYAEFYPRGEQTEPGDIIQLDINSKEEKYIKATSQSTTVVGVHSDTYGHLIGGEEAPEGREFVEYNLEKYIPVGLVGRVNCKIIGTINKGDRIVVSEINGVGRKFNPETDNVFQIVGMAVEDKETEEIKKIKVNFRGVGCITYPYFSHLAPLSLLEVTNG